jgi:hypothetical protein
VSVAADLREQLQATLSSSYAIDRELAGGGMSRVFVGGQYLISGLLYVKVGLSHAHEMH